MNPYTKSPLKSDELKANDISEIQRLGSRWENQLENLDESKESIIFGQAIEKSSLDHFNAFDNSVATHEELKKADNFFEAANQNTLKRKSFEDIFGVESNPSAIKPTSDTSGKYFADLHHDSKQKTVEEKKPEPPSAFTKRKSSSVAQSSKNNTPKNDKNVG